MKRTQDHHRRHGITRRSFFSGAGALGAAAALTNGTALSALLPTPARAAEAAPMPGGTMHLAAPYGSALKSLDPHATWRSQDMVVSKAFHRSLYSWDTSKNAPAPDLAASVTAEADGMTHTYKLHDNAYFHNGRQVVADDVIWSFTRVMDPDKGFPGAALVANIEGADDYAKGKAKTISGLKKIDDLSFQIKMKNYTDPGLLFFDGVTSILPKEEVAKPDFLTHPVGCGPFSFSQHVAGSSISGKKFDKYYKPGKPYADGVHFVITGDYSALDMAFRSGELDATVLSASAYALYKNDAKLSKGLVEVHELFTRHMGMNLKMKPFDDEKVRQAINYAIDRDLIIDKLIKGKAFKAVSWLPSSSIAFDETRKPYPFDVDKAKELMKASAYPDGAEVTIWATNGTNGTGVAQAITPYLAAIGLKVTLKVVESSVLSDALHSGTAQAWLYSSGTGPDPIAALRDFDSRVTRAGGNTTGFSDPAYDKMLDDAAGEVDPDKRRKLTMQADGYIFDKAPVWFFNTNKAVVATQPWIHNVGGNVTEAAILEVDDMWLGKDAPGRS
ncbi:ABC transporter substrate-binding protein [Acidimangrovimonas sediminis]|uniref:ABC transporter substrate-binding protein n=1 Tax=Acidimangrovimonas sediminis TaxID=2056283 RepID=UPI000C80714D|nr:ABC transporter substrate-binding protein [Acidimangrovimonas sediminis]